MTTPEVCCVTFPNSPTPRSGKGLDRYAYELTRGVGTMLEGGVRLVAPETNRSNYMIREVETIIRLRHVQAKIFHATSEYGLASLILARKRPIVVTIHDLIPQLFFGHSPAVYANQRLHLSLVKHADLVIATSNYYAQLLQREFQVPQSRLRVVHYGVDHNTFRSDMDRRRATPSTILYLGGLRSLKGAKDVLEAFSKASRLDDARLLFGGRGKYALELQEISKRLAVAERVSFLGFVDEGRLPALYNSSDVLVWPSYTGFGLSTLEAMACGTPVVCAKALDSEEYLGGMGLLYNPGDVEQLAGNLEHVLSSKDSWKKLSTKALGYSENFSWKKMASETYEAYNCVARLTSG